MLNKIGSTGIVCCFALAISSFGCDAEYMCGDGVVDPDEACDDGNAIDGDACSSACQVEPACGDGTLDAEEACDDGNLTNGDGCSATCEFDDVSNTPGDDRTDYLTCTPEGGAMTCGPGTVCCGLGTTGCAANADQCSVPFGVVECDGPEDCASGEHCWSEPKFTYCAEEHGNYSWIKCHTDADCPEAWDNPCSPDGGCYGDLRTDNEIAGDVRPGFILCKKPKSEDTSTCGPGTGCCTSGTFECAEGIEQCGGDSPSLDACDGPEDCDAGEQCWVDFTGSSCQIADPSLFIVRCHVHEDCIHSYRNPCTNGQCVGTEGALGP